MRWYRKAAEQGNDDAQYELGRAYYYGNGVEEDDAEAVKWYKKAAEQGNSDAADMLENIDIEYDIDDDDVSRRLQHRSELVRRAS